MKFHVAKESFILLYQQEIDIIYFDFCMYEFCTFCVHFTFMKSILRDIKLFFPDKQFYFDLCCETFKMLFQIL